MFVLFTGRGSLPLQGLPSQRYYLGNISMEQTDLAVWSHQNGVEPSSAPPASLPGEFTSSFKSVESPSFSFCELILSWEKLSDKKLRPKYSFPFYDSRKKKINI